MPVTPTPLSQISPRTIGHSTLILRDAMGVSVSLTESHDSTPIFDIRQTAAVGVGTPADLDGNTTLTPFVALHDETTNAPGIFRELKDAELTLAVSEAQTLADTLHAWHYLKLIADSGELVCDICGKS